MSVATRREKEKLERRKSILIAARDLFYEKGYQTTTVEEIAEAADVSKGTVYLYFSSKDELYVSVVLEGFQIVDDMITDIMASESSIVEKGKAVFLAFAEYCMKNREYFRITQYFISENARKNLPPTLIESVSGHTARLLGHVAALVEEGKRTGLIIEDMDPYAFALIAWRTATGILDLAIVGESVGVPAGPYNELFEQAIELLVKGILK
ncbi:MAG TPA: TetR/AcrR family transcriptional regulator [Candidatus Anoxymicrobiaceae bacterium]